MERFKAEARAKLVLLLSRADENLFEAHLRQQLAEAGIRV